MAHYTFVHDMVNQPDWAHGTHDVIVRRLRETHAKLREEIATINNIENKDCTEEEIKQKHEWYEEACKPLKKMFQHSEPRNCVLLNVDA